jgi:hypothetical protein
MSNTGTVSTRPFADRKLISLEDVKPGLRVQTWHHGRKTSVFTITSYPFFDHSRFLRSRFLNNALWVGTDNKFITVRSLADIGIVPYPDGNWNTSNYSTLAKKPDPVRLSDADTSIDFFRRLSEWLKGVDEDYSAYQDESEVTVVVPQHLRRAIGEHDVTKLLNKRITARSGRIRALTIRFVHE